MSPHAFRSIVGAPLIAILTLPVWLSCGDDGAGPEDFGAPVGVLIAPDTVRLEEDATVRLSAQVEFEGGSYGLPRA